MIEAKRLPEEARHPFHGIHVRAARTSRDIAQVYAIRHRGYAKYITDADSIREDIDQSPGCVLLLASDGNGNALGTMRLLDSRFGPVELERFQRLDRLVPADRHPLVEASRFSVPAGPQAAWVKLALYRASYQYGRAHQLRSLLIWIKRSVAREYRRLLFEEVHGSEFIHPVLGHQLHSVWVLDIGTAPERYRQEAGELYRLLYAETHPNIRHD